MAKRKRRPGGGRKPGGEFPGKSATFTTRIQPSTRRALEEAAKDRSDKSISAAADIFSRLCSEAVRRTPQQCAGRRPCVTCREYRTRHEQKLARRSLGRICTSQWRRTLGALFHPRPVAEGTPPTPKAVEELAEKMGELREQFRKPHGFGLLQAQFLIREIEQAASSGPINEWTMPIFFSERREKLALIGSELADSRKGKPK